MRTYNLFYARDGETVTATFQAEDDERAEVEALSLIKAEIREDYPSWEEAQADGDGATLEETDEIAVAAAELTALRELERGVRDMVDNGRLSYVTIPDDWHWLFKTLLEVKEGRL